MAVFLAVVPSSLVEVYRQFRDACCLHRTSETSVKFYQTTWHNNPEDSHLHTHHHENLKSHLVGGCQHFGGTWCLHFQSTLKITNITIQISTATKSSNPNINQSNINTCLTLFYCVLINAHSMFHSVHRMMLLFITM
jgi:hypothetical protein